MKHNFTIGMRVREISRTIDVEVNTIQHFDMVDDQYAVRFAENGKVVKIAGLQKEGGYFPEDFGEASGMRRCHFCHWHPGTGYRIDHPHWLKGFLFSVFACGPCIDEHRATKEAHKFMKGYLKQH